MIIYTPIFSARRMAKTFSDSYNRMQDDYVRRHFTDKSEDLRCLPSISRCQKVKFAARAGAMAFIAEIANPSIV